MQFLRSFSVLVLCLCALNVSAQVSDTFRIKTMIGDDTTPPSSPTNLIVEPVAPTQINLTWDASVDDWVVSGYHLWRDDVLIATTTALAFNDIGLSASTSYTYYITAFDAAWNESASSTLVSSTTLALPPPPHDDDSIPNSGSPSSGTRILMGAELRAIEVIPGQYGAFIRYATRDPLRAVIRWGETAAYELGSVREEAYLRSHETALTGLVPDTVYSFSIEGELGSGRYGVLYTDTFRTLPVDDVSPPSNVRNLTAVLHDGDIELHWENPVDADFDRVRVLRSNLFYPTDAQDGWLAYEGNGAYARDIGAATHDGYVYYTVFTYDKQGNMSSGAVVRVLIGEQPALPIGDAPTPPLSLSFSAVQFSQEGIVVSGEGGRVLIDGAKSLVVSIPYDALPEHLKTILIEIRDPADPKKHAQFLLRVDETYTAYTATIAPMGVEGNFPVTVIVYDFDTRELGQAEGTLVSRLMSAGSSHDSVSYAGRHLSYFVLFMLILFGFGLSGYRLVRRSE